MLDLISKSKPANFLSKEVQAVPSRHKIVINGPTSVLDLAKLLGVRHKEVIIEATRLGFFGARGETILAVDLIRQIAANRGFAVDVSVENPPQ